MKTHVKKMKTGIALDYYHVPDKQTFRFLLLKKILHDEYAQILIDTNLRITDDAGEKARVGLERAGLAPQIMRTAADPKRLFGFNVRLFGKNAVEYLIVAKLHGSDFNRTLFDAISGCDIGLGIGRVDQAQTPPMVLDGFHSFAEGFEKSLYDSIVCTRLKSSFDISREAEEVADEMGL